MQYYASVIDSAVSVPYGLAFHYGVPTAHLSPRKHSVSYGAATPRTLPSCEASSHHWQYAAHILPFARFGNDDMRNGMALCKMHHWLFDKGLISVDQHYLALVSKEIEAKGESRAISWGVWEKGDTP